MRWPPSWPSRAGRRREPRPPGDARAHRRPRPARPRPGRHEPARQADAGDGSAGDRAARETTRARKRRRVGDQRQDHDRGFASSILAAAGIPIVHNMAGANMSGGVVSALLERQPADGSSACSRSMSSGSTRSASTLAPRAWCLANLFRDQLDRYGELETIGDALGGARDDARPATLVLNADDPLIADLGRGREGTSTSASTIPPRQAGGPRPRLRFEALPALRHRLRLRAVYIGHLGVYQLPGLWSEPAAAGGTAPSGSRSMGWLGASFELRTPPPRGR